MCAGEHSASTPNVRSRTDMRPGAGYAAVSYEPLHAKATIMLYTVAVILLILWVLGMVSSYTMGGLIHVLLVVALVVVLVNFISGRRVL